MNDLPVDDAVPAGDAAAAFEVTAPGETGPLVEQDLLVEDVSIDGMCGVY